MKKFFLCLIFIVFLVSCKTTKTTYYLVSGKTKVHDVMGNITYKYWIDEYTETKKGFKRTLICNDSIMSIRLLKDAYDIGDTVHVTIIKF